MLNLEFVYANIKISKVQSNFEIIKLNIIFPA